MPPKTLKPSRTPVSRVATRADKKSQPKKELSKDEALRRLFAALCAQIDGGHFKNALKTCDKSERLSPPVLHRIQLRFM